MSIEHFVSGLVPIGANVDSLVRVGVTKYLVLLTGTKDPSVSTELGPRTNTHISWRSRPNLNGDEYAESKVAGSLLGVSA